MIIELIQTLFKEETNVTLRTSADKRFVLHIVLMNIYFIPLSTCLLLILTSLLASTFCLLFSYFLMHVLTGEMYPAF